MGGYYHQHTPHRHHKHHKHHRHHKHHKHHSHHRHHAHHSHHKHHKHVPLNMAKFEKNCWGECGHKAGACNFCGANGVCCCFNNGDKNGCDTSAHNRGCGFRHCCQPAKGYYHKHNPHRHSPHRHHPHRHHRHHSHHRHHRHHPHRHHKHAPHSHTPHSHTPHKHRPHRHSAPPSAKNDPFAMNCINEDHLLQVVTAAMPFGSWYMHGSGGKPLGAFLDVRGIDLQFYFMYRNVLKAFVPDPHARNLLLMPTCTKHFVPDESDGIPWLDSNKERLCHLYWARQMKKMLADSKLVADSENTTLAKQMLDGLPGMDQSIGAIVMVTIRAVFHKRFPWGQQIYTTLSTKLVDALMASAPQKVKDESKAFAARLKPDKVLGFENPHDGLVHVINIFRDFLDAMFFQEEGKFGPGAAALAKKNRFYEGVPPTAGCTVIPHATWHRKAARVILEFVKMGKSLKTKLKNPDNIRLFYMQGLTPKGLFPS